MKNEDKTEKLKVPILVISICFANSERETVMKVIGYAERGKSLALIKHVLFYIYHLFY